MENPLPADGRRSLYIALSDQLEDGLVLRALCDGREVLRFERSLGAVTVTVSLNGSLYSLYAPQAKGSLALYRFAARVALYADDALADEEWPLDPFPDGEWTLERAAGVPIAQLSDAEEPPFSRREATRSMYLYAPEGHNAALGDCMPFLDGDRLRLFYLFDRRAHASKRGLGAHRWAQLSTADLRAWTVHPMAIGIDEVWEGSICTGSLVRWEGLLYAFYAVRMADGSAAKVTWAISEDGERFRKSGVYVTIGAPYDAASARDPLVFQTPDGMWNMLVTTSLSGVYEGGCLAWLRGDSPTQWRQTEEPFLAPGYPGQPECPDWFCWNGKYYAVFSSCGTARYRLADGPLGPWRAPEDDLLTSPGIRVPKTAAWQGGRRIAVGFLSRGAYAGRAVFEELCQAEDGSLRSRMLEEALPVLPPLPCQGSLNAAAACGLGRARITVTHGGLRLHMTVSSDAAECGVSLCAEGAASPALSLRLRPRDGLVSLCAGDSPLFADGRRERLVPGLAEGAEIDFLFMDGAAHAIVNGRGLIAQTDIPADARMEAHLYALWGTARAEGVRAEGADGSA